MDIVWFRHDRTIETLRPAVLPDDTRLFLHPIAVGLIISVTGFFLDNSIMLVLPLIVLAVFPGLPVSFHLIYYLFVKIELLPDRLVVTDWVSDGFVRCDRYDVSRETRDSIEKALTNDSNFDFEYLETAFAGHSIDSQDLENLIDELTHINADTVVPFLQTKVDLARYQKAENQRHGAHVTARIDNGLVLSNEDGTKKVYFTHFHDLSNRDLHRFMDVVRSRQPGAEFLMTQRELHRLLGR